MAAGDMTSPVFDFTSLDFPSVREDLILFAQLIFGEEVWTDFNSNEEGVRLIELMSYASDLLAYNENSQVREGIVASLIRRQNFINIASKVFDFDLKSATPAKTTLRFTLDGSDPTIPKTFKVADEATGEIIFQPDVDLVVTGGATQADVAATQGNGIVDEVLALSSPGTAGQRYALADTPLIDDTLEVTVNGVGWTEVSDIVEASATDEVYLLETDENDVTTVVFGDGINGKIPPTSQQILASYKIGGGSQGNLPAGTITKLVSSLTGVLAVTNITAATQGGPRQSLQSGKELLPAYIKTNERAVTTGDYAALTAQLVPGVLKASAVSGSFQGGGNSVIIFVVPNGGGDMSTELGNEIVTTLRYGVSEEDPGRSMAGKRIIPKTAEYVDLEIDVEAYVKKGSIAALVAERVRTALTLKYDLESVAFGSEMSVQEAYNTLDPNEQQIDGLDRAFFRRFRIKPRYGRYVNLATSGDGTIEGISVTSTVLRREWNVTMVPPSGPTPEFEVVQRRLGRVTALTNTTVEDESQNYAVNSLENLFLHPREQEQDERFTIQGNTSTIISVDPTSVPGGLNGLLLVTLEGDSFAVESTESTNGHIVHQQPTAAVGSGTDTVPVTDSTGFNAGDKVLVREGTDSAVMEVLSTTSTSITFTTDLAFSLSLSADLDWYWQSDDGTVGFAVVNGATSFTVGDTLYVDTFPEVGDIKLRPENFPLLADADLSVSTIGGVR